MRRPEAILFDLWGTLFNSVSFDPVKGNAAVLALAENPRGASLEQVQDLGRRVVAATVEREEQSALEFTQGSLLRILADAFDLRFRHTMEELEWEFWNASLEISLVDGVLEMLPDVRARGIRSCVISNSSFTAATIERELGRQGIRDHFEFVVSSADYGIRKPDALIFEAALLRMGVDADKAWFAGDNVGYDIVGARGAGLFPVAFQARSVVPDSIEHAAIARWSELAGLVEAASRA
jgi:putative hydrolase of the HAD superfamily